MTKEVIPVKVYLIAAQYISFILSPHICVTFTLWVFSSDSELKKG